MTRHRANTFSKTPIDFDLWLGLVIQICRLKIQRDLDEMSANHVENRLKEKIAKASGAVGRIVSKIEAKADAIIAKEASVDAKADEAFAPHEANMDAANQQLDTLADALTPLSNGGPQLDEEPAPTPVPGVRGYPH